MISIDVNALNDREKIADAIAKLTTVLTALETAPKARRAPSFAEFVERTCRDAAIGVGFTPYQAQFVTRFDELTPEDLNELNAGPSSDGPILLTDTDSAGWERLLGPCRVLSSIPFMDPQEAIQGDGIVCLIDGEKRKFLSRYVRQVHGLGWEEYLRRFDLPADYPRTSKDVIEQRKELAIERGLGKTRAPEPDEEEQRVQVTIPVRRTFGRRSAPQQVSVQVDIGSSVNTTVERRKERRLGVLL